jgi:hypothetical protein
MQVLGGFIRLAVSSSQMRLKLHQSIPVLQAHLSPIECIHALLCSVRQVSLKSSTNLLFTILSCLMENTWKGILDSDAQLANICMAADCTSREHASTYIGILKKSHGGTVYSITKSHHTTVTRYKGPRWNVGRPFKRFSGDSRDQSGDACYIILPSRE